MIDWVSLSEFEARLRTFKSVGLSLCTTFHARVDEDPATRIPPKPDQHVEDGIGVYQAWAGFVDGIPFSLRSSPPVAVGFLREGYAIEVWLPAFLEGDVPMFDALARLPIPAPRIESIWIESPRFGSFGVARKSDDTPLYSSHSQSDAAAAVQLLNRWHPDEFVVIDLAEVPSDWLVSGPTAGPYLSHVARTRDEESARRLAASYSAERNVIYTARRCWSSSGE